MLAYGESMTTSTHPSVAQVTDAPPQVNAQVLGDTGLQSQVLESNANAKRYHAWLCSMARPYLGDDPLEIGSGMGDYGQTWLDGGLGRITLTEVDPGRRAVLQQKFRDDPRARFATVDLDGTAPGDYSSVVSFNVMEHVPDDVAAFTAAFHLLRPGGYLVTLAPAFPALMSEFDRSIGHVRRYTRENIAAKYRGAGFDVVDCRYVNALGMFAWFAGMRVLRMTPGDGPILRVWDAAVVPVARCIESRLRMPFGQSVLAVGRKPLDERIG